MKIEFENEQEKECLKHILFDWLTHNGSTDVLGCDPACRDESSPGCDWCIKNTIDMQFNKWNQLKFWCFGGEDWLMKHNVERYVNKDFDLY